MYIQIKTREQMGLKEGKMPSNWVKKMEHLYGTIHEAKQSPEDDCWSAEGWWVYKSDTIALTDQEAFLHEAKGKQITCDGMEGYFIPEKLDKTGRRLLGRDQDGKYARHNVKKGWETWKIHEKPVETAKELTPEEMFFNEVKGKDIEFINGKTGKREERCVPERIGSRWAFAEPKKEQPKKRYAVVIVDEDDLFYNTPEEAIKNANEIKDNDYLFEITSVMRPVVKKTIEWREI